MRTTLNRALVALGAVLILGAVVAFATGGSDQAGTTAAKSDGTDAAASSKPVTTIEIANFKYAPPNATVKVGAKLTFVNKDNAAHTATAMSGGDFDSGTLKQGQKKVVTIAKAGEITYICQFHPFMKGKLTVR